MLGRGYKARNFGQLAKLDGHTRRLAPQGIGLVALVWVRFGIPSSNSIQRLLQSSV